METLVLKQFIQHTVFSHFSIVVTFNNQKGAISCYIMICNIVCNGLPFNSGVYIIYKPRACSTRYLTQTLSRSSTDLLHFKSFVVVFSSSFRVFLYSLSEECMFDMTTLLSTLCFLYFFFKQITLTSVTTSMTPNTDREVARARLVLSVTEPLNWQLSP